MNQFAVGMLAQEKTRSNRAKQVFKVLFVPPVIAALVWGLSSSQKVNLADGVRIIHNNLGGRYRGSPPFALEFMQTIGDIDTDDVNFAFNIPEDLATDISGNIYVLDSGNHRIQKFSPDAIFVKSFGRRGQGPAEFNYPERLAVDQEGNMYVLDRAQARIHILSPSGEEVRSVPVERNIQDMRLFRPGVLVMTISLGWEIRKNGLPRLIRLVDYNGSIMNEFVDARDFGGAQLDDLGNSIYMTTGEDGHIFLTYQNQNRLDKYSSDGRHIWSATRKLNFDDKIELIGRKRGGGGVIPSMIINSNQCSAGIAADSNGRVWVIGLNRQRKADEQAGVLAGYGQQGSLKTRRIIGDKDFLYSRETDIFRLEIFDSDGILLGDIPLTHFADRLIISGGYLFILDKAHACAFYQYRIVEK